MTKLIRFKFIYSHYFSEFCDFKIKQKSILEISGLLANFLVSNL